jgi:hypothetical protein
LENLGFLVIYPNGDVMAHPLGDASNVPNFVFGGRRTTVHVQFSSDLAREPEKT